MNRALLAVSATLISVAALAITPQKSPLHVSAGSLETFTIFSPQLQRDVTVDVWLPDGYTRTNRYPVVYMHDGQMLHDASATWNHQAWEVDSVVSALVAAGEIDAPIIVGPYNVPESRISDYMPTEPIALIALPEATAQLKQWMPQGARGADYVDFLAETLKPAVDSLYSTRSDMASTSTMGSSMGGLISLYAMCRRPDVFGAAACMSTHLTGTVGHNETFPSALMGYLVGHIPTDGNHRIYFDTGDQDIDEAYLPYFPRIVALFREAGYTSPDRLTEFFDPGQGHNEKAWAARLHRPMTFLLGRTPSHQQ